MTNRELVEKVLDHIGQDLEHWDQEEYVQDCGTTMCFAGWALHLSGYTAVKGSRTDGAHFKTPDGTALTFAYEIQNKAMEALGFDDDQVERVFCWHAEDHFWDVETGEMTGTREDWFAKFKEHVLAVTGIKVDTEV